MRSTCTYSDEDLFQSIQYGDEKAFDTLFLKYYGVLCAYAKQFVGYEEREEIVQDVMTWLWQNKEKINIETSPKNYLFRAVKNSCFTLINRNEIKQRIFGQLHDHTQSEYEDPDFYIVEELTERIELALNRLPPAYREAFELNRFQNMTYQEIATKLGGSPKTIDYRIQQALKLLRVDLKEYLPFILLMILINALLSGISQNGLHSFTLCKRPKSGYTLILDAYSYLCLGYEHLRRRCRNSHHNPDINTFSPVIFK